MITSDLQLIEKILYHHFISRSVSKHYPMLPYIPFVTFTSAGEWIEQITDVWRFSRSKVLTTIYLLIPVTKNENIFIMASGLVKNDWIFGCLKSSKNGTKFCIEGENLSHQGEIIPSKNKPIERKMINLRADKLIEKQYPYVLVQISPLNSQIDILIDKYKITDRTKHFKMPSLLERFFSFSSIRLLSISLIDQTVFYNLTLSGAAGVFEAINIQLETRLCRSGSKVGQGLVKLVIPWSKEDSFHHVRTSLGGITTIPIKVHRFPDKGMNSKINLQIMLDPECSVVVLVRSSLSTISSQFIKFYGLFIPAYIVALLMVFSSGQLYAIGTKGICPTFYEIFGSFPTFISLVAIPTILYHGWISMDSYLTLIPKPDNIVMDTTNIFFTLILRTFLYLISCGLIFCIYIILEYLISWISIAWIWIWHKSILNVTQVPLEDKPIFKLKISKLNLTWSALLAAIAIGISSSLSITLATFICLIKLFSMRARSKAEEERRGASAVTRKWYFHFTLLLLLLCGNIILIPGLIAWIKNLKFSLQISNDPHLLTTMITILGVALLWQIPSPSSNRLKYKVASHSVHIIASLTTLYSIHSHYRLLYSICSSFVIISLQQTYAFFNGPYSLKIE